MERIIKENIAKNILVIAVLIAVYAPIQDFLTNSLMLQRDIGLPGDILAAVSLVAVIACFGNFAFTYEKIDAKSAAQRYLAHATTGLLMLVMGGSLMFASVLISIIMGPFVVVNMSLALLYVACVLYDFWDLLRIS